VVPKSPTKDAATDPVIEPDFINTDVLKELADTILCLWINLVFHAHECARITLFGPRSE
jgi:hypothetical protein